MKKDKEEVDIFEKVKEEELPTPVFVDLVKESEPLKEERDNNGGREEESGAEDKTDLSRLDIHTVKNCFTGYVTCNQIIRLAQSD